jgi:tetraacyldisaccharide 4'-kinase
LKGLIFDILRWLTLPISFLYGGVVWLRNKLYDWKLSDSLQFSIPIINVGNLSAGGTGKTPHTEYLIEMLQDTYSVATLSRGYKRYTRGFVLAQGACNARDIGDEPMQFFWKYPSISVCVCEDRIIAVPQLMQRRPHTQVLLLDDAFQHRSIAPSLNILLTDYSKRYTQDFILPFGSLREFRSGATRADIIVVTKCPGTLTQEDRVAIAGELNAKESQTVFYSTLEHQGLYNAFARRRVEVQNTQVLLVTAIANNAALVHYLQGKCKMVHTLRYRDHHYFTDDDVKDMIETYSNMPLGNNILLCTEKDYTRLVLHKEAFLEAGIDIHVLPVKISFLFNEAQKFEQIILQHLLEYYPILKDDYGTTQQYETEK